MQFKLIARSGGRTLLKVETKYYENIVYDRLYCYGNKT